MIKNNYKICGESWALYQMWIRNLQRTIENYKERTKKLAKPNSKWPDIKAVTLTRHSSNIWKTLRRPPSSKGNHSNCQLYKASEALTCLRSLFSSIQIMEQGEKQPTRSWRVNYCVSWERTYKYCYRDLAVWETNGYTEWDKMLALTG